MKVKIAVFDVCGTIYPANTTVEFLNYVFGKYSFMMMIYRLFAKICIILGVPEVYDKFRAFPLKGKRRDEVRYLSEAFVRESLSAIAYIKIINEIEELKQSGFKVVLISASIDPVVSEIANSIQAKRLSSRLEIRNGTYTGRFLEDYLEPGKKAEALMKIFDTETEVDWNNSVCYSDSERDLKEWSSFGKKHFVNEKFIKG